MGLWVSMRSALACRFSGGNGTTDSVPGRRERRSRIGERSVLKRVRPGVIPTPFLMRVEV